MLGYVCVHVCLSVRLSGVCLFPKHARKVCIGEEPIMC